MSVILMNMNHLPKHPHVSAPLFFPLKTLRQFWLSCPSQFAWISILLWSQLQSRILDPIYIGTCTRYYCDPSCRVAHWDPIYIETQTVSWLSFSCCHFLFLPTYSISLLLGNSRRRYSCLENPMHRGPWWAIVHRVAKSRTRLGG